MQYIIFIQMMLCLGSFWVFWESTDKYISVVEWKYEELTGLYFKMFTLESSVELRTEVLDQILARYQPMNKYRILLLLF